MFFVQLLFWTIVLGTAVEFCKQLLRDWCRGVGAPIGRLPRRPDQ